MVALGWRFAPRFPPAPLRSSCAGQNRDMLPVFDGVTLSKDTVSRATTGYDKAATVVIILIGSGTQSSRVEDPPTTYWLDVPKYFLSKVQRKVPYLQFSVTEKNLTVHP